MLHISIKLYFINHFYTLHGDSYLVISSMGRAKVTFHPFRSHLPLVPKSVLGGKVTWERTESDSPSGQR